MRMSARVQPCDATRRVSVAAAGFGEGRITASAAGALRRAGGAHAPQSTRSCGGASKTNGVRRVESRVPACRILHATCGDDTTELEPPDSRVGLPPVLCALMADARPGE